MAHKLQSNTPILDKYVLAYVQSPLVKPTTEQFQGCLIGCAVGDAVGAPVESLDELSALAYVRNHLVPKQFKGLLTHKKYPFGQYTDDTQLTRELALSLAEKGRLDPEDFADRLVYMFKNDLIVGSGRSTRKALARLSAKAPWYESGEPHPAAGNGSAMRAAPVGLFYWHQADVAMLKGAADCQGIITHKSLLAASGAFALALSVSLALSPDKVDSSQFLRTLIQKTEAPLNKGFVAPLKQMTTIHERHPALGDSLNTEVLTFLKSLQEGDPRQWDGISPFVVPSVLWSIHCFLAHPDDFWSAISLAISAGGDTDTCAAMTGAICGAHVGLGGIPQEVATLVNDRGESGYGFLCKLGKKLHEISVFGVANG